MKKHPRLTAMYCPRCGEEDLRSLHPYAVQQCRECSEELRYERLPGIVLRKRIKAARNCNSKAARG